MGYWSSIDPSKIHLEKVNGEYPWVFAAYIEFSSETDDNKPHTTLLFRNSDWTIFGIKKYSDQVRFDNLFRLAQRIAADKALRDSLTSDDPDLPRLWKRH